MFLRKLHFVSDKTEGGKCTRHKHLGKFKFEKCSKTKTLLTEKGQTDFSTQSLPNHFAASLPVWFPNKCLRFALGFYLSLELKTALVSLLDVFFSVCDCYASMVRISSAVRLFYFLNRTFFVFCSILFFFLSFLFKIFSHN